MTTGKRMSEIDGEFRERQTYRPGCQCGAKAHQLMSVEEGRDWFTQHRLHAHNERYDPAAAARKLARTRKAKRIKGNINTRDLTHHRRRENSSPKTLQDREALRYRP